MTVQELTQDGSVLDDIVEEIKTTPGMGKTIAWGALFGFIGLTAIITVFATTLGDVELGGALGFGLFSGTFGGAGFGGMMGGVVAVVRSDDEYH